MRHKTLARTASIAFSIFLFIASVFIAICISLAFFDVYGASNGAFWGWAGAIIEVYKFSAFFLPLILLYASIMLFVPGWNRLSRSIFFALPFIFFISVAEEYSLTLILPKISNIAIANFTKIAIILIALFAECLVFIISNKMSSLFFKMPKDEIIYHAELDIVAREYESSVDLYDEKENDGKDVLKNETNETFFSLFKVKEENPKESSQNLVESLQKEEEKAVQIREDEAKIEPTHEILEKESQKQEKQIHKEQEVEALSQAIYAPQIQKEENIAKEEIQAIQQNEKIAKAENQTTKEIHLTKKDVDSNIESSIAQIKKEAIDLPKPIQPNAHQKDVHIQNGAHIEKDEMPIHVQEKQTEDEAVAQPKELAEKAQAEHIEPEVVEAPQEKNAIPTQNVEKNETLQYKKDEPFNLPATSVEAPLSSPSKEPVSTEETEAIEMAKINNIEAVSVKPQEIAFAIEEKRKGYHIPFDLLKEYPGNDYWIIDASTRKSAFALKSTLNEFKINVEITGIRKGPVVTMFEVLPPPGIKLTKITALQDNIALRLAAESIRIVAPIPGKRAVGIEVPNEERAIVGFRELIQIENPEAKKMAIPIVLGKDITGEPQTIDLAQTPHLLIAGATGAGKSVCVNSIILSILYNSSPNEVKLLLVDPKIVELKLYNDIGHLLTPVITEPKKAFQALQYCICEMERRYAFLDKMSVRDIKSYNKKIKAEHLAMERLPYIVIIIDEFADLMATTGKELEGTVSRLCAMSRAVGIHLVLATQRPSTDVITGLIKANIPSRIAFMVASRIDSRIILDDGGADKLLGKGDMLYVSPAKPWPTRIQGAYVSEDEVERVVNEVKKFGEPDYIDDEIFMDDGEEVVESFFGGESDPLYDEALDVVLNEGKASASYIQRRLKIGYNRAARIIEDMEKRGVVGPANGSKARDILQQF